MLIVFRIEDFLIKFHMIFLNQHEQLSNTQVTIVNIIIILNTILYCYRNSKSQTLFQLKGLS